MYDFVIVKPHVNIVLNQLHFCSAVQFSQRFVTGRP